MLQLENAIIRRHGQTDSSGALRGGDGSHHSRCRFRVLQKPILGTADSEYWHCLGVRSFLLEISQAFMNNAAIVQLMINHFVRVKRRRLLNRLQLFASLVALGFY